MFIKYCVRILKMIKKAYLMYLKNDLTPPSNLDDTLFDGSFTRWMPYLTS